MESLNEDLQEYRRLLQKGSLQRAYRGLMAYLTGLRAHLQRKFPAYTTSGSLYCGSMDMSYFSFSPASFKPLGLKVAVVFLHEAFRFEVWLSGYNKEIQGSYQEHIRRSGWDEYHLVPSTQGSDAILEHVLVAEPDFSDPDALTGHIEAETLRFIQQVEGFLTRHPVRSEDNVTGSA